MIAPVIETPAEAALAPETQTTLQERELNDLAPKMSPIGQVVGDPSRYLPIGVETGADMIGMRALAQMQFDETLRARGTRFKLCESALRDMVNQCGQAYRDERERLFRFSEIYQLCERRSNNRLVILLDSQGTVVPNAVDGHAKLKLTLGLGMSAINTAVPVINDYVMSGGSSINKVSARSRDDESPDAESMIQLILDHQHEQGNFDDCLKECIRQAASYPAGVMRQRWTERLGYCMNPETGDYEETVEFEGEQYDCWPLPRVLFSDPNKRVEKQRCIIWASEVTIPEILAEERVHVAEGQMYYDPVTGNLVPMGLVVERGELFNLEHLKAKADDDGMKQNMAFTRGDAFSQWAFVDDRAVDVRSNSAGPLIGKIEQEGFFDFGPIIEQGAIDADLLANVFLVKIPGMELMSKAELARRLSGLLIRITFDDSGNLIGFKVITEKPARPTALVTNYIPGDGIYGHCIPTLGENIARVIDQLLNDNVWISMRRADPNTVIDKATALLSMQGQGTTLTNQEIAKLVGGKGQVVQSNGGQIKDLIQYLYPDADPQWVNQLFLLIDKYNEMTLVNEQLRGQTENTTATQSENNLASSSTRVIDVAERMADDIAVASDRRTLIHFEAYLQGRFDEYVMRIAGAMGLKAHYMLPGPKGLSDQVKITHAGIANRNREVRTAQFGQTVDRYGLLGVPDPQKCFLEEMSMIDVPDPERLLAAGTSVNEPDQEIKILAQGKYVKPSPLEDAMAHMVVHVTQLAAIAPEKLMELDQTILATVMMLNPDHVPVPPGLEKYRFDPAVLLPPLMKHIKQTQSMIQALIAQQQAAMQQAQMEAEMAAQGGGAPGGKPGAGGSSPNTQTTQQSQRNGVQQSAPKPPLAGMVKP